MLRTVTTFRDPWNAHLLRARLLAEDIPAFVVNDQHVGTKWHWSLALGGVRVMVPPCRIDDARAVWAGVLNGVYRSELEEEFGDLDDPRCRVCGTTQITRRPPWSQYLFAVGFLSFGIGVKIIRSRCACANGHRWTSP